MERILQLPNGYSLVLTRHTDKKWDLWVTLKDPEGYEMLCTKEEEGDDIFEKFAAAMVPKPSPTAEAQKVADEISNLFWQTPKDDAVNTGYVATLIQVYGDQRALEASAPSRSQDALSLLEEFANLRLEVSAIKDDETPQKACDRLDATIAWKKKVDAVLAAHKATHAMPGEIRA
jgi:hypothetical protein